MAVITKVWTVPVPARQDPAVPITTSWGNDTWDNLQFLLEWMGAGYVAGAVQDHNHDGVNSAVVNVFEGLMPNGSFDEVSGGLPIGWSSTEFTGGTVVSSSGVNKHGEQVVAITSTVLANGGGDLIQDKYKAVTDNKRYGVEIYRWASVENVSCRAELVWYDEAKAQISTTVLFTDINTATTAGAYSNAIMSPAGARFVRVRLTGGVPATGSAVGTVYFDGGRVTEALPDNVVDAAAIVAGGVGNSELASNSVTLAKMAPNSVGANELIAGSVHTSELNTLVASISSSGLASTSPNLFQFIPTGGYFIFNTFLRTSTGGPHFVNIEVNEGNVFNALTYSNQRRITFSASIFSGDFAISGFAQWRYVSASPPHNMGDGDIPAFIYATVKNATGEVESISYAAEPVWLHNGPTKAMPDFWRKGKKYKYEKIIPVSFSKLSTIERAIAIAEIKNTATQITNEMVHADMDLIPHPFLGNDLSGRTVIMLDPVCDCVRALAELDQAGEDVHQMIRDGYVSIGNTALKRVTPAGLLIPETSWKKPKRK